MKLKWGYFQTAFPVKCEKCGKFTWEMRVICENCGGRNTLRKTTKKDYKTEMKRRKERNI